MARLARKQLLLETGPARARPRTASEVDAPRSSPARLLQDELSTRLATAGKPDWSPRRTLAFVVLTSGGAWSLIGAAVFLALR